MASKAKAAVSTALVEIHGQQAQTTSLALAEGCGVAHRTMIQNIRKHQAEFEQLGSLAFEMRVIRADGRGGQPAEVAILNEDQATYAILLTRNTERVRAFKLRLVKEFRRALNRIAKLYAEPPRKSILQAKRAAHNPMMDALIEYRESQGKAVEKRHYWTENRLCNLIAIGSAKKVAESALDNARAERVRKARELNTAGLRLGLDYETRKRMLADKLGPPPAADNVVPLPTREVH